MSHFTVMVIGNNPESQLEPFDEQIRVDEYQVCLISDESKKDFMETYQNYEPKRTYTKLTKKELKHNKSLSFDELYKLYGEDWNGNSWRKNDDGQWAEFSTYNPKSKWDWYSLGGRWSGEVIKLKPGRKGSVGESGAFNNKVGIDAALKGDINFEKIKNEAKKEARKHYKKVLDLFGGTIPTLEHTWKSLLEDEKYSTLSYDEKRKIYNDQEPVKVQNKNIDILGWNFNFDNFRCTEDEYAEKAENRGLTFAVLKNGKWYERGKMGWWSIVINEKEENEWNKTFYDILNDVPDDTLISIYDCHI